VIVERVGRGVATYDLSNPRPCVKNCTVEEMVFFGTQYCALISYVSEVVLKDSKAMLVRFAPVLVRSMAKSVASAFDFGSSIPKFAVRTLRSTGMVIFTQFFAREKDARESSAHNERAWESLYMVDKYIQ
jgi:hypothetical protein